MPATLTKKTNSSHFFEKNLIAFEKNLEKLTTFNLKDPRHTLEKAIHHSLLGTHAKRTRPLLLFATYSSLTNAPLTPILPIATAIELTHTYSLIHDDLPAMDNDDFRRGKPSCHVAFGEDLAILAGDVLNSLSFEILATSLSPFYPANKILEIIKLFGQHIGLHGIAGGQVLDLHATNNPSVEIPLETIHELKTGRLISLCIDIPLLLHPPSNKETHHCLSHIGPKIGLLFQIVDDILDVSLSQTHLGKTPLKDISQNKLTYVSHYGLEKARKMATNLYTSITEALNSLPIDTTHLKETLSKFMVHV